METEDQLSSDEDDGSSNNMGMQLLEYMKDPGTGWKSQDKQLIASFIEVHSTPFELPEGEDMPELMKPPPPWLELEDDHGHVRFVKGSQAKDGSITRETSSKPPDAVVGSTISKWKVRDDVASENKMAEQKHAKQRDGRVDRAIATIEQGEDELILSHLHLDDIAALKCAEKLKANPGYNLTKFNISLNHLSIVGATAIGAVLAPLPKLTTLSFSHNSLGNDGTAALAQCFKASKTLTELNLDHNGIGPDIPQDLYLLTTLRTLNMRNNKLETFPLDLLKKIPFVDLEDNPAHLNIFLECELEDEAEEAEKRSARRRTQHSLGLAWLAWENLDMPRARDMLAKARKDALLAGGGSRECPSLVDKLKEAAAAIAKRTEALGPSFVRVDDPAQIMVGNAIERASLKVREKGKDISLLNQQVGDVGMTSMAEALLGNASVTWLDISGCNVGPNGIKSLVPWIAQTPVLQTLWVASNPLGDQGCVSLCLCVFVCVRISLALYLARSRTFSFSLSLPVTNMHVFMNSQSLSLLLTYSAHNLFSLAQV